MDTLRLPQRPWFLMLGRSIRRCRSGASFLVPYVLLMLVAAGPVFGQFGGGSGTAANPYQVATPEHLNNVRNHLSAHFLQTAHIDLNVAPWNEGAGWNPIGTSASRFTGKFDGNGHNITGLKIDRPTQDYVGLFGYLGSGAEVRNAKIIYSKGVKGKKYVGILAGAASGAIIEDCDVSTELE